jgi:hypothetical protein
LQRSAGNAAVTAELRRRAAARRQAADTAVHGVLRSPGSPLPGPVRADAEARLGADFSRVRVHTDGAAHDSARAIDAHAYTSGDHIAFQRGHYGYSTPAARRTLTHELAHVVQQRSGPVDGTVTGGLRVSSPGDRFEREADAVATAVSGPATAPASVDVARSTPRTGPVEVQRAVGFEFETSIPTLALAPGLLPDERNGTKEVRFFTTRGVWESRRLGPTGAIKNDTTSLARGLRKKEVLVRTPDFRLEADEATGGGSDLEFVTTAFPEDAAGLARLTAAMTRIVAAAQLLLGANGDVVTARDVTAVTGGTAPAPAGPPRSLVAAAKVLVKPDPEYAMQTFISTMLTASPQTTAGVRLDKIPDLLRRFVQGQSAPNPGPADQLGVGDAHRIHRDAEQWAAQTAQNWTSAAGDPASPELRGLLTLVGTYLLGGERRLDQAYLKGIVPLLARTDLATAFRLVPEHDELAENDGAAFVALALAAAHQTGRGAEAVYDKNIGPPLAPRLGPIADITRQTWLEQLTKNVDLLSRAGYRQVVRGAAEEEFESMGEYGDRTENVGAGIAAPILELRRMRSGVPHTEWAALALAAFTVITGLNAAP